jgi:predicted nucleic acid-binding Zn finger protein
MATQIVAPAATVDHAALDTILSNLERRYGHDPRIDRAYRIVMSGRVELCADEPTTALVHGDSGRSYYATVDGFCECPDAERVARCKHSLACIIAVQLAAVAQAKAAQTEADATDLRALYARLCQEQQQRGRLLSAQGIRPNEDATWLQADEHIRRVRAQLPSLVIR